MHHVLALMLSAAVMALMIRLVLWHVEGPGIRRAVGRIVCGNRGSHRLTLGERHYLLPSPHSKRRPFCITCCAVVGD